MVVFRLDSDKYFVQNNYKDTGVRVYQYEEYTNFFGMIHANCPRWTTLEYVPGSFFNVSALELFGVTITNEGLATLARDLIINGRNDEKFHFVVNRQGVCFVNANQNYPIEWMRINGLF
ncbi:hypothetical protein LINPERHAP2_LOCUS31897 [Linum perenne]